MEVTHQTPTATLVPHAPMPGAVRQHATRWKTLVLSDQPKGKSSAVPPYRSSMDVQLAALGITGKPPSQTFACEKVPAQLTDSGIAKPSTNRRLDVAHLPLKPLTSTSTPTAPFTPASHIVAAIPKVMPISRSA